MSDLNEASARIQTMRKLIPMFLCLVAVMIGCEQNDLGRYCIVGQPVPTFGADIYGQPSVTILNLEAPECFNRLCIQQGPFKLHPDILEGSDPLCQADENFVPDIGEEVVGGETRRWDRCVYPVRAICSKECKKHSDCSPGPQESNICGEYVCHRQAEGEVFEGHCICVCKDFLINPTREPPAFYRPEEVVPEPQNCR